MRTISDGRAQRYAWAEEHLRVAREVARLLPPGPVSILEVGCGKGQLTVPLARELPEARILAVDNFQGPYSSDRGRCARALAGAHLTARVRLRTADGRAFLGRSSRDRFHGIVSSELLPELTCREMTTFFDDCYRSLAPGGISVHVFLSPIARTAGQRLTIEADSDPRWTANPLREWFSPPPELSLARLKAAGFSKGRLRTIPGALRFRGSAARRQLRSWGVREGFGRCHREDLGTHGLELPDWVIVSGMRAG